MASLFDIFGERAEAAVNKPMPKKLSQLRLGNENLGNVFNSGSYATPIKPNEPLKRTDNKKSFLVNKGTTLQSTPLRIATPFGKGLNSINKQPLKIYNEFQEKITPYNDFEIELEFHKPAFKYDNYERDVFDDMAMFSYGAEPTARKMERRSPTPEPCIQLEKMSELTGSYDDEFFNGDFSNDSITVDDLDLPSYY